MDTIKFDNMDDAGREALRHEWRETLLADPRFTAITAGYNMSSISGWLDYFTEEKMRWMERLEQNMQHHDEEHLTWVTRAGEHLEVMLQKKLFDIQCRWRAELVRLEGVEICYDFDLWEKNVFNCPFVEPLTPDDVEMYRQYLLSSPDAEPEMLYAPGVLNGWQDYDRVKELLQEPDGEVNLPAWYQYHNQFTNAGMLLRTLPDIRGEKEDHYRHQTFIAKRMELEQQAAEGAVPADNRPHLYYYMNEDVLNRVLELEPEQVRRARTLFQWSYRFLDEEEDLMIMTAELLRAETPVPVAAHANWYEALKETSRSYRCRMIAEALPQAFEQYQMHVQTGIAFPFDEPHMQSWQEIRKIWADSIIKGRELLGEPGDFNF